MRKYVIIPNRTVGSIHFGMERCEVRNNLEGFTTEFKKSKFSKNTTDDFGYCHVFYDVNNKCIAVEFWRDCELVYQSKNLFDMTVEQLVQIFPDLCEEYGCYISKKYSIGITFEDEKVDGILVGCENYYY